MAREESMIPDATPEAIATARLRAGHTQAQAASSVGALPRQWQRWETGESAIPDAAWWLYLLRVGRITLADLPEIPERQRMPANPRAQG